MRSVIRATCTSGEPVSPFLVAFSVITVFFRSGVTAISTPKSVTSSGQDNINRIDRLQGKQRVHTQYPLRRKSARGCPLLAEPGAPGRGFRFVAVGVSGFVGDPRDRLA